MEVGQHQHIAGIPGSDFGAPSHQVVAQDRMRVIAQYVSLRVGLQNMVE